MNNTSKSQVCKVQPGTYITGKWHKHSYKIIQPLGYGATGFVYLAEGSKENVALKISESSTSITSEVNVLKHFSKVQGSALGPSLLDVDDWVRPGYPKAISFYVMEYIKGESFLDFIHKKGNEWTGVLCLQLLADLDRLHQEGWVFGDLKPDNLIVTGPTPKIRCIDVGGTTINGRAIKEFTEFFDRGYWGMGTRKAEPTYDLFAVAMIMINAAFPKRFSKTADGKEQLKNVIRTNTMLRKYEKVLLNALMGRYQSAAEMRTDMILHLSQKIVQPDQPPTRSNRHQIKKQSKPVSRTRPVSNNKTVPQKQKPKGGLAETVLIVLFVTLAYVLYIYGQIL